MLRPYLLGTFSQVNTRAGRRRQESLRRLALRPVLEGMEARIAPATRVWTGAVDNVWTDAANWDGAVSPGDDLVFPAGAARLTSANDFPAGTTFGSITVAGSGYSIVGNAIRQTGGIAATYTSGSSAENLDTDLSAGAGAVTVAPGGVLDLGGAIGGGVGLNVSGGGTVRLVGSTVNTYDAATTVGGGSQLVLAKTGVLAVPDALVINQGTVTETNSAQVDQDTPVTVNQGGTFDLNGNFDTVGGLILSGGTVRTGAGGLILRGDVTVNEPGTPAVSSVAGTLYLAQPTTTFTVADGTAPVDLVVSADVAGFMAGVTKAGAGTLLFSGPNEYEGPTAVNAGVLAVSSASGLGSTAAGTTVAAGAELDLTGGDFDLGAESLNLAGTGAGGGGALVAGPGVHGGSGPVNLSGPTTVVTTAGAEMTFRGQLVGSPGNSPLTKAGTGSLVLTGDNGAYGGDITVAAGELQVGSNTALGNSAGTTTVLPGASLALSNVDIGAKRLVLAGDGAAGGGALRSLGGISNITNITVLTADTTINVVSGNLGLNGITNDGGAGYGVRKTGAGDLYQNGTATYTGVTDVLAGRLVLFGHMSGAVAVGPGAALVGDGIAVGVTSTGGTVGAGQVLPGIIFTGDLALDPATTFTARLDGPTTGYGSANYDQAVASGVALNGATLAATLGGGYVPEPGDSLTLISNTGSNPVAGTFAGLPEGAFLSLGTGASFRISYAGGDGNDVVLNWVQDTTTTVTPSVDPSVYGQRVTFTANVSAASGQPTGSVGLVIDGTALGFLGLNPSGQSVLSINGLQVGPHTIAFHYQGDAADAPSTGTVDVTVNQASTTTSVASSAPMSLFGQPVTLTATVAAAAPGVGMPTGTVDFYDGPALLGTGTLDGTGTATFTTTDLGTSPHTITAVYPGDVNFVTSTSAGLYQLVTPASTATTVVSSASPSVYGQSVTFTATVSAVDPGSGVPTGAVDFYDNGSILGTGTLDGTGTATFTTGSLAAGPHSITADYVGDIHDFPSNSAATDQPVSPATTAVDLVGSAGPIVFGETTTLTVAVTPVAPGAGVPGGDVTFRDNGQLLGVVTVDGTGMASITYTGGATGVHVITADYGGGENDSPQGILFGLEVDKAAVTASVTGSPSSSVFGQSVTFTATVSAAASGAGVPTGGVYFFDGGTFLGSAPLDGTGTATFTTSGLSVADHGVTGYYEGDANFLANTSAPAAQTVERAATTTAVTTSDPTVYGQSATLTATVSVAAPGAGTPTGLVEFYDGATDLGSAPVDCSGTATFVTSALTAGTHGAITAAYAGDANVSASTSAPVTQDVGQATTTTALDVSPGNPVFGQEVDLSATVVPVAPGAGVPTGSVDFYANGTKLGTVPVDATGHAIFRTTSLDTGLYSFSASYPSDPNFLPSVTSLPPLLVQQAPTAATLAAPSSSGVYGQSVTFTSTVVTVPPGAGVPTGHVVFFDGATLIGVAPMDGNGQSTFTTSALGLGPHSLTVLYSGGPNFAYVTSPALAYDVVPDAAVASVSAAPGSGVYGQGVTFTATVAAADPGSGVPTGSVDFYDGATFLASATLDPTGHATYSTPTLTQAITTHPLTVVYHGDANFLAATSPALNFVVGKSPSAPAVGAGPANPVVYGQHVTFTAHVSAGAPGAGVPTGLVEFLDGANVLGLAALDPTGTASLTTASLPAGGRSITVEYSGDANFLPGTSPAFVEAVERADDTASIVVPGGPTVFGQPVTVSAALTAVAPGAGVPSGMLELLDGETVVAVAPLNPSGAAVFHVSTLAVGSHGLSVAYVGDGQFNPSASAPVTQVVSAATTTTTVNPAAATVSGQPVTITAVVAAAGPGAGTPAGPVTFFDGMALLGTAALDASGVATLTLPSLGAGGHAVTAVYNGGPSFTGSASPAVTLSVAKADTLGTLTSTVAAPVAGQPVTFVFTASAVAPGAGALTGSVTFSDGTTPLATVPLVGGVATITTTGLSVGSHSISAAYSGDGQFNGTTAAAVNLPVGRESTATWLTAATAHSVYGQWVTLSAIVTAVAPGGVVPAGGVVFFDGTTELGVATPAGGVARFTVTALAPGDHHLTAVYLGGSRTVESTAAEFILHVAKGTPALSVSAGPAVLGQPTAVNVSLAATAPGGGVPANVVVFYDNNVAVGSAWVVNGQAQANLDLAPAGSTHTLTVGYLGDDHFQAVTSAPVVRTVAKADTRTALSSVADTSGGGVWLVAAVQPLSPGAGAATGSVTFAVDGQTFAPQALVNGWATLHVGSTAQSHTYTATYTGNASLNASTAPALRLGTTAFSVGSRPMAAFAARGTIKTAGSINFTGGNG